MNKVIYFDMDGTIADLYAVNNWLEDLRAFRARPYEVARPMWDMTQLVNILQTLKNCGYTLGVITWLSKETTKAYDVEVRKAKRIWLENCGLWSCFEEVHMVKYGTPKHTTAKIRHGILVDDNAEVRKAWETYGGETIDPTTSDIIEALASLVKEK